MGIIACIEEMKYLFIKSLDERFILTAAASHRLLPR